jgi:methylated-DNA-[protein]-cysteine S-methyltransferase
VKDIPRTSCSEIDGVADQVLAFLEGEAVAFALESVRLDLCTTFQQKVLRAEHAIPRGCVSTYGRIAAHLGNPRGARAVGTALATNPFPIIIPCHRAIRTDRTLGGYQGGQGMKRALLEMEGIEFDDAGRVTARMMSYR